MEGVSEQPDHLPRPLTCCKLRREVLSTAQLALTLLVIVISTVGLLIQLKPTEIWVSLLSAAVGFLAPAPIRYAA